MTTTHLIGLHVELPRGHDQHAVVEAVRLLAEAAATRAGRAH